MNVRALAVPQNPHLQTRGRGQLHWESDISAGQRAGITHQGDEEVLQKFIADNYDALNTEPLLAVSELGHPELALPRAVFQPQQTKDRLR